VSSGARRWVKDGDEEPSSDFDEEATLLGVMKMDCGGFGVMVEDTKSLLAIFD